MHLVPFWQVYRSHGEQPVQGLRRRLLQWGGGSSGHQHLHGVPRGQVERNSRHLVQGRLHTVQRWRNDGRRRLQGSVGVHSALRGSEPDVHLGPSVLLGCVAREQIAGRPRHGNPAWRRGWLACRWHPQQGLFHGVRHRPDVRLARPIRSGRRQLHAPVVPGHPRAVQLPRPLRLPGRRAHGAGPCAAKLRLRKGPALPGPPRADGSGPVDRRPFPGPRDLRRGRRRPHWQQPAERRDGEERDRRGPAAVGHYVGGGLWHRLCQHQPSGLLPVVLVCPWPWHERHLSTREGIPVGRRLPADHGRKERARGELLPGPALRHGQHCGR
mmetsp:Transcript_21366/g.67526  ORF Transcript_21366/g.67526 Transcript_21366/m.67526 type:complete len:326 (+) Transcript_21366:730-1707(+)